MTSGTGNVLLVDDDPAVRLMIKTYLRQQGISIIDTASGEEAWEIIAQEPSRIQLLVTDLLMPGMPGKELARRVREAGYGFPVLFLSGYVTDEDETYEGMDCLPKPLDLPTFVAKVTGLIEREVLV
jgi:two-component system cell cycle sensor histidine kinase/response regulator CckA